MDHLHESSLLFHKLYQNVDGYQISFQARQKLSENSSDLTYGEIPFVSWRQIILRANPKNGGVFFDLGSGSGRVVLASCLLFNFRKSVGVELLSELHEAALAIKTNFEKLATSQIKEHIAGRELHFICSNFLNTDLRDADFIFINHILGDKKSFAQLERKLLNELKSGTKIVTTIRRLANPAFKRLGSETYKFNWGNSRAHFFEV